MVTPHEEATTGDRHGSPLAVSNIAESICPAIPRERQPEHSVQKIRHFYPAVICSCDDPCLSKFGALRRGMSALRETICRTFVQHLPVLLKKT